MAETSYRQIQFQTLEDVLHVLRENMPELSRRYRVKSLGVFGSYVRGEADEESDIDLLVDLEDESLTLLQFIALENHLSDLLGVKVDLVEKNALKPAIGRHILEEVQAV